MDVAAGLSVLDSWPPHAVDTSGRSRTVAAGQAIFRQGEPTTGLWAAVDERVAMERGGPPGVSSSMPVWRPEPIPVSIAGLRDGAPYGASGRALDAETRTGWAPREEVVRGMAHPSGFAAELCWHVADRLRCVQVLGGDARDRPLTAQPAAVLSVLARRFGPDIARTHEELAHLVEAQRETVTRVLAQCARQGWIDGRYGRILVRDLARWTAKTDDPRRDATPSAASGS